MPSRRMAASSASIVLITNPFGPVTTRRFACVAVPSAISPFAKTPGFNRVNGNVTGPNEKKMRRQYFFSVTYLFVMRLLHANGQPVEMFVDW